MGPCHAPELPPPAPSALPNLPSFGEQASTSPTVVETSVAAAVVASQAPASPPPLPPPPHPPPAAPDPPDQPPLAGDAALASPSVAAPDASGLVGTLVQVSSERCPARADWGLWGRVTEVRKGILFIHPKDAEGPSKRNFSKSHAVAIAAPPTAPAPWKKQMNWMSGKKLGAIKKNWLATELPPEKITIDTMLEIGELSLGLVEIGWRVMPKTGSFACLLSCQLLSASLC